MSEKPLVHPARVMPKSKPSEVFCHKYGIPMAFPVPSQLNPKEMNINAQFARVPCCKEQCALWNAAGAEGEGECWDVSAAKAQAAQNVHAERLNFLIEQVDGLLRIPDSHQ